MSVSRIQEGDQIIIKTSKVLKVFQVRRNRVIRVEKTKFTLDDAIGTFYGSSFEAKAGKLVRIEKSITDSSLAINQDTERDNRNLKDTAENQKLKKEDIQAMRKEGASGHEIVDKLVDNSSTFQEKTEFSKEKYIKKKKKKHVSEFTILKPNTRLLAKMYYSKGPVRMCNLRYDSIAQILTHGNVHAGCKLMVFESVVGLLVGALLERLGGHGEVVQFYTGSAPARQAMEPYNFPIEVKNTLLSFPLNQVNTLNRDKCKCSQASVKSEPSSCNDSIDNLASNGKEPSQVSETTAENGETQLESKTAENIEDIMEENIEDMDTTDKTPESEAGRKRKLEWEAEKDQRRQHRQAELARSRALLESGEMDSLIVASKWHPTPIVMGLLDFVAPGRPIVIFSQYKEPLLDCYVKLRNRGGVVNMRLSETWLRNYQVLPNRTHPEINMSSAGGYLLTGTTVIMDKPSENDKT